MKEVRILVTGVGRRIELMQAFRQAALELNINLKLYGADMAGTAPALAYCNYTRKVCAMRDPDYINQLAEICQNDKIDIIMPTIDTDLLILSQNKEIFERIGTKVLISAAEKILICRDKNNTGAFFESCGVKAPKTYNNYLEYDGPFPCFIKPKDGSSSINAYKVEDFEELSVYAASVDDYIVQPFVEGREYTIDIFCDFEGNPIYITPRERLQVRAGEVLKTEINMDETMIEESKRIVKGFNPCGPITVQLIQDKNTGDNYYIEINPRFGGGAPLSIKAGANSAKALLEILCEGKTTANTDINNGAVYSRFDQSVCIDRGSNGLGIKGVIFDLDDTLYPEKEYVRSGYKAIADYLGMPETEEKLWQYFVNGDCAIDKLVEECELKVDKKELLSVYRNHMPQIELYDGVLELIEKLLSMKVKVGIITDGRVEGQKNKLEALGLNKHIDDIIITDELGGTQFRKPNDISYRIIQNRWRIPFAQIIYVGDNPSKDFSAPKQLGMGSLYFCNPEGLYVHEQRDMEGYDSFDAIKKQILDLVVTE